MNVGDVVGTRTAVERSWRNRRWCVLMRCQCGRESWAREYDVTKGVGLVCQGCMSKRMHAARYARA